jgi:hypothetical protein
MAELPMCKRQMRSDGGNHHEEMEHWEFSVWVKFLCLIQHVRVAILQLLTPFWGLHNPISHVVPIKYHICSDAACCSQLHSPSLCFVHYSTIIPEYRVKWSLTIVTLYDDQLPLCKAYTEYTPHWIQHPLSTPFTQDCLCSLHWHNQ